MIENHYSAGRPLLRLRSVHGSRLGKDVAFSRLFMSVDLRLDAVERRWTPLDDNLRVNTIGSSGATCENVNRPAQRLSVGRRWDPFDALDRRWLHPSAPRPVGHIRGASR